MIYSFKTLVIAMILFVASMTIIGTMYLPIINGENGFKTMENTFNSLRKGVKPPFDKIGAENEEFLGKNFKATFVFKDNEKARTATLMFLRNKLTVTPKGRTVNIQGDLGYTLKFFMNDIHLLYMNHFDQLERRYSMPPTYSMYMLDRILKKFAITLASQKKKKQEALVKKIRQKLLIPAYNLRAALPVRETSGFTYLALGTFGILLFAILWDISNFLFFGTLTSDNFMKTIRVAMGREMSDQEKALLLKREKIKKKKAAAAAAKAKKTKEGKRTNKEALQEVEGVVAPKRESTKKVKTKTSEGKKKTRSDVQDVDRKAKHSSPDKNKESAAPAKKSVSKKKAAPKTQSEKQQTSKKKNPASEKAKNRKAAVPPKDSKKTTATKSQKIKTTTKKQNAATSQKDDKKVTTHQTTKKSAPKATPEGKKKSKNTPPKPQAPKRKSAPEKPKAKQQDKI